MKLTLHHYILYKNEIILRLILISQTYYLIRGLFQVLSTSYIRIKVAFFSSITTWGITDTEVEAFKI